MSSKRDARFWFETWWPVLLGAVGIALTSNAYFGADRTGALLLTIWDRFFAAMSHAQWYWLIFAVRKTCHFVGYGLIGLTWLRAWRLMFPRSRFFSGAALAVLGTVIIACCDEFHQTLIPNRTGSSRDVLIDGCGAAFMCFLAFRNVSRSGFLTESPAAEPLRSAREELPSQTN